MSTPDEPQAESPEEPDSEVLRVKSRFHPTEVHRQGDVVVRDPGPWTPAVHSLLRHLEEVGFAGAPRIVGSGFDADGRETLTYIEGEFLQPGPWSLEGAAAVGQLLRELHEASASFRPAADAVWWPWFGRALGGSPRIVGHCDAAPWNIVTRDGLPVGLIDWERTGPVDPRVELAQVCWLNAKLHHDIVAEREGLPPLGERAHQLRAMVEAYGLPAAQRRGFIDLMIEVVAYDTAEQANEAEVTPDTESAMTDPQLVWALSWRARDAAWLYGNRALLQNALA